MRQLARLLRHRVHPRSYLRTTLTLSLALLAAACGSRVATPQPHTAASAGHGARTAASIRAAQLVAGKTGWVLSRQALSLTSDNGRTWRNITPSGTHAGAIRGVHFMDAKRGWVVSSSASNPAQLEISSTTEAGASWSTADLGGPVPLLADSAPAYIDFVDARHGWVAAMIASGSGVLPRGILFRTSDGGAKWQQLPMPVGGPVEFVSPTAGLVADGIQGEVAPRFYVTSDGGRRWTAETVTPPAGFTKVQATYTIPAFTTPADVILVAFDNGTRSVAGFYQTNDGGASWQLKATVPAGNPAGSVSPAATVIDATHWVSVAVNGSSITDVRQAGTSRASKPKFPPVLT
jgi:photosystem II stability/assembly factor-like uncharacterized protein